MRQSSKIVHAIVVCAKKPLSRLYFRTFFVFSFHFFSGNVLPVLFGISLSSVLILTLYSKPITIVQTVSTVCIEMSGAELLVWSIKSHNACDKINGLIFENSNDTDVVIVKLFDSIVCNYILFSIISRNVVKLLWCLYTNYSVVSNIRILLAFRNQS